MLGEPQECICWFIFSYSIFILVKFMIAYGAMIGKFMEMT